MFWKKWRKILRLSELVIETLLECFKAYDDGEITPSEYATIIGRLHPVVRELAGLLGVADDVSRGV